MLRAAGNKRHPVFSSYSFGEENDLELQKDPFSRTVKTSLIITTFVECVNYGHKYKMCTANCSATVPLTTAMMYQDDFFQHISLSSFSCILVY